MFSRALFYRHRSTQSHNAHKSILVTIAYSWHPLHGQSLQLARRDQRNGEPYLVVQLPDGTLCALPAWMTDSSACSRMTLSQARASCSALCDLQRVLARLPLATDDNAPIPRENADVRTIDTPSGTDVGNDNAGEALRSSTPWRVSAINTWRPSVGWALRSTMPILSRALTVARMDCGRIPSNRASSAVVVGPSVARREITMASVIESLSAVAVARTRRKSRPTAWAKSVTEASMFLRGIRLAFFK
jgi:hypothetical protein